MSTRRRHRLSLPHRFGVTVTSSLLIAAALGSVPIQSAVAADEEFEQPTVVGNKNTSSGSESDLGVALAKAQKTDEVVEVKSLRTETESIFANPDGTVRRDVAQAPIRAENADGDLVTISTDLTEDGGRLAPEATTGDVSFSDDGDGAAATYAPAKGQRVSMSFDGDLGEPLVDGAVATYPVQGEADQSVQVYARDDGFASRVVLAKAPEQAPAPEPRADDESTTEPDESSAAATEDPADPDPALALGEADSQGLEFRFDVDVKGLSPSLKDGVLSFADAKGEVVAQSSPLLMWDSRTDEAGDVAEKLPVDADLERDAGGGFTLVLRPSMEFLTAADTQYPVVVDPDINAYLNGDTYYYSDQSSYPLRGQEPFLRVGSDNGTRTIRSLVQWSAKSIYGLPVTDAKLELFQYYSGGATCTPTTMRLYPTTETSINTWWGNRPPIDNSLRFSSSKAFSHGVSSACPAATETIDVTQMVNAWGSGHSNFYDSSDPRGRQGIELRAADELNTGSRKHFCSQDPDNSHQFCKTSATVPKLSITYSPELGVQDWYSMTDHQLNDRSSLSVNNKNGNAVVSASDVSVNGLGVDLSVDRTYNSQSPDISSMGRGWSLGVGPDVWLEKKSQYRYDFHAPGGAVLRSFVRKSATPSSDPSDDYNKFETPLGGARADLSQSGSTFTLKFRGNRTSYEFEDNSSDDHAYMTLVKDRSGNNIEVNYSGETSTGKPKMSSAGGNGQLVTVTYSGDYISQISQEFATSSDPQVPKTTREWKYGYNSGGYLTSYTDPLNNVTNYAYQSANAPADVLSTITAPANDSGDRPKTELSYSFSEASETNRVSEARYYYRKPNGDQAFHRYTWAYGSSEAERPDDCKNATSGSDESNYFATVTDPNDNKTTYCYRIRNDSGDGDRTWVYDGAGHGRSIDFSADNGPTNVTNPSGQGVANGSTVMKYSTTLSDQIESATEPKSDADDRATTAFAYGSSASNGGSYQPTASKDTAGNCNRFGYDSSGRTTDAYTGISATGSTASQLQSANSCEPTTANGVKRFHRDYNSNGTVSNSWDANAGSGTPDLADQTVFTYWTAASGAEYVPGSSGQVKTIRKPGGNCAATVAAGRSLCTSYAYDGAGRVTSITNGNAITTRYMRDKMDRSTAVIFGGAESCNLTGTDCLQYAYDAEGNLTTRTEGSGRATAFDYDQMNRQIKTTSTEGLLLPTTTEEIGAGYDGTGNLTGYNQAVGGETDAVTYAYNVANRLETVTDSTGAINIETDLDGRTSAIVFPKPDGSTGTKANYDFTETGKPKSLTINTNQQAASTQLSKFSYDYKADPFAGTPYAGLVEVETPQVRNREVTGSVSNLNTDVDYSYEKNNRLTKANATSGTDYEYSYDGVGNIVKDQGVSTTRYGYNRAGELCWQGPDEGSAAQKLSRVCATGPSGSATVNHDKAGNSTGTTSAPIEYNDRDQVTTIGGTTMGYRDLGNDIRSDTGATSTVSGPIGITATKTGSTVTFYTRDPQGTILNSHSGGTVRNYVTEYNSSVAALYNPAGNLVGSYKYAPYGATAVNAESGGQTADNNRFRYISGYQDTNNAGGDGYYKLGARYYDGRGHFTQPDAISGTISDPKTLAAFNYANGDPVNFSDPSGYFDIPEPVTKIAGEIGGCVAGTGAAVAGYTAASFVVAPPAALIGGGGAVLVGSIGCAAGITAVGSDSPFGDVVLDIADAFEKARGR